MYRETTVYTVDSLELKMVKEGMMESWRGKEEVGHSW